MIRSESVPTLHNRMRYLSRSGTALSTTIFQLWQDSKKPKIKVTEKRERLTVIFEMLRLTARKQEDLAEQLKHGYNSENCTDNAQRNQPRSRVKKLPELMRASSRASLQKTPGRIKKNIKRTCSTTRLQ